MTPVHGYCKNTSSSRTNRKLPCGRGRRQGRCVQMCSASPPMSRRLFSEHVILVLCIMPPLFAPPHGYPSTPSLHPRSTHSETIQSTLPATTHRPISLVPRPELSQQVKTPRPPAKCREVKQSLVVYSCCQWIPQWRHVHASGEPGERMGRTP